MATVTWIGTTGNWSDAADWSTGTVPGADDDVVLPSDSDSDYHGPADVTVSTAITVHSLSNEFYDTTINFDAPGLADKISTDVTNDGFFEIDTVGNNPGGTTVNVTGTFTNAISAYLILGPGDGDNAAPTTVTVGQFANQGYLGLYGGTGSDSTSKVSLIVEESAPATLPTQNIELSGNALLQYASGQITELAAEAKLTVSGSNAFVADAGTTNSNSALALTSNAGDLTLMGGAAISNAASTFTNSGEFSLYSGSTFATNGAVNFVNSGTVIAADEGASSPAGVPVLTVGGELINSGTINIGDDGTGPVLQVEETLYNGGTLYVGTEAGPGTNSEVTTKHLVDSGSVILVGDEGVAATLDDLDDAAPDTLSGKQLFSVAGNSLLEFTSGEITSIAHGASLNIDGSAARIANSSSTSTNSALSELASNAGTLTLLDGAKMTNAAVAFSNSGAYIVADNTTVTTNSGVAFGNSGTLGVDNANGDGGSDFKVGGTLTNTGTVSLGNTSLLANTAVSVQSLANSGVIDIVGDGTSGITGHRASLLDLQDAAPSTLAAGVAINLSGFSLLEFGSGSIATIAEGAEVTINGRSAILANETGTSSDTALANLSDNAGVLSFENGASIGIGATAFTNSGAFSLVDDKFTPPTNANVGNSGAIDLDTGGGTGGSQLNVTGTLTNSGTIAIGEDQGNTNSNNLAASTSVYATHFSDTGQVDLYSSIGSSAMALFDDRSDAAPTTLAAGAAFNLVGNALLEFASGEVSSISKGAEISVDGTHAFVADSSAATSNSALNDLSNNAGTLSLADGASLTESSFTNSGTLNLDTGDLSINESPGGSSLKATGTLTNSGTIDVGNSDDTLSASSAVSVGHLVNAGAIVLESQSDNYQMTATYSATLTDKGDAVPTTLVKGVSIILLGNSTLEYASGSVTTIASGASVSLNGSQEQFDVATSPSGNSALNSLSSNLGTLSLDNGAVVDNGSNNLVNHGTIDVDSQDANTNTVLTIGGLLTNEGTIKFDNSNDEAFTSDYLQAGAITNSGTMDVVQGEEGGDAGFSATGTITNTGTIELSGSNPGFDTNGDFVQTSGTTSLSSVLGVIAAAEVELKGGLFEASGSIEGNVLIEGGIFEVGTAAPLNRLVIEGNVELDSGGVMGVTLADSVVNTTEAIGIDGRLSLDGGTLLLNIPDPQTLKVGEQFESITADSNEIAGTFAHLKYGSTVGTATSVNIGNGLAVDIAYNDSAGTITLTVVSSSSGAAPAASNSLAAVADHDGFHFSTGVTDALSHVTQMDPAISGASLADLATDAVPEQLGAYHALLFTETGSAHAGAVYLVIDANGVAGYQAGQDFAVQLNSQEISAFSHIA